MRTIMKSLLAVASVSLLGGCAADLSSGNKFTGFQTPPPDKALVYMVRDENFMATKLPYMIVATAPSDGKDNVTGQFQTKAIVGKDMFVPVLMDPGYVHIKTGAKTEFDLKPGSIQCAEVGGKYRGVATIFTVEPITDREECQKMLTDKFQGVELAEAKKRTGIN